MTALDSATLNILKTNNLFQGLSEEQFDEIIGLARISNFQANELIVREGDPAEDIFILIEGEVEILKKEAHTNVQHCISTLQPHAVIGELALLDQAPRSASVRTTQPTTLIALAIADLKALSTEHIIYSHISKKLNKIIEDLENSAPEEPIYSKISTNLARQVSERLRVTNESVADALRKELALEKTRVAMGDLLVNLITLISLYSIALGVISKLTSAAFSTTLIGAPILSIFAAITFLLIKKNPYPLSFYGMTLHNWRQSTKEALLYTLPILALIVIIKFIIIHMSPAFHNEPLFNWQEAYNPLASKTVDWVEISMIIVYLIFIPVQELMYRGFLQGSLQEFLVGPKHVWSAIIISNLVFSMTHLHVSFGLALAVFLPGLFWGWLYSRHGTLIGVCISHIMVGMWAFFIVGIKFFLSATS